MAATTIRAKYNSTCAATGRTYTAGTLIFKSVLGWAIFDSASFAAVREAVAAGQTSVIRPVAAENVADFSDRLNREMSRADSAY